MWVVLPEHFLACRQTFIGELHKKDGFGSSHGRSKQGKQTDGARKTRSLVTQGRWSLFAVQFLYENVRTRESGRLKQVVAIRAMVTEARYYCMSFGLMHPYRRLCIWKSRLQHYQADNLFAS